MDTLTNESFEICPTDVARAPIERVWQLLTDPAQLHWIGVRLREAPARTLVAGDRLRFSAPLGLRVTWDVLALEPQRSFTVDIRLPFGIANRETFVLSRIDADSCRITFN